MDGILIFFILLLNFGISWWNCYAVGRIWVESKAVGGFIRVLCWCGAIQATIGFSSVILFTVGFVMHLFGYMPPELAKWGLNLWYLLVIVPCVGTGFIIMAHSWALAWRDRSLLNLGSAAYNTFAQIHNTVSMVQNLGPAFKEVGGLFEAVAETDDARAKLAILAIILVMMSIVGGGFITAALIKKYSGTIPLPKEPEPNRTYHNRSGVYGGYGNRW